MIYRPDRIPNVTRGVFFDEMADLLDKLNTDNPADKIVLLGDFNFHLDNTKNPDTIRFQALLQHYDLVQLVCEPTHEKGHTLDLIITRNSEVCVSDVSIGESSISDHYPVHCYIDICKPPLPTKTIIYRNLKAVNQAQINEALSGIEFTNVDGVDELVDIYNRELSALLDDVAPARKKIIRIRPNAPWLSQEIVEARKHERRLERKWRHSRLTVDREIWKHHSCVVDKMMKSSKVDHFSVTSENTPPSDIFRTVKALLYGTKTVTLPAHTDATSLANQFNVFFVDKVQHIRDSFPEMIAETVETYNVIDTLDQFGQVSTPELKKVICSMRPTNCSLDPIPAQFLRKGLDGIIHLTIKIINCSLQSGIVPTVFKQAILRPQLKKSTLDTECLKNYRPISNLSFLSKVLERVVSEQLTIHLNCNDLAERFQSAYKQRHSVETALVRVHNDILVALDNKQCILLVLLDLSAAFDTVDHTKLIHRLEAMGIAGIPLKWFKSYLHDRSQKVSIGGQYSEPITLKYGVPQGSVLGPLLFSAYITPIGSILQQHQVDYHLYADDSQLYMAINLNDIVPACATLSNTVGDLDSWMRENFLKCNADKTDALFVFTRRMRHQLQDQFPNIRIIDSDISPSSSVRNLGVVFDSEFSFKLHISQVVKSCNFHLRNIGKIRNFLSQDVTRIYIHALITSRLDFCNSLLSGLPNRSIQPLQRVQNNAARLVSRTSKYSSITPVLFDLHWLPVEQRIRYKVIMLAFQAIHKLAPSYISELLSIYTPSRALRSSNQLSLVVPKCSSQSVGGRAFSINAPYLWNRLPDSLRDISSPDLFRSRLKCHLFKEAFKSCM